MAWVILTQWVLYYMRNKTLLPVVTEGPKIFRTLCEANTGNPQKTLGQIVPDKKDLKPFGLQTKIC